MGQAGVTLQFRICKATNVVGSRGFHGCKMGVRLRAGKSGDRSRRDGLMKDPKLLGPIIGQPRYLKEAFLAQ